MQELVKNLLLAMGDTIRGLDWMSPETKAEGAREARDLQPEDRLPRQVEGLLAAWTIARDALLGRRRRGPPLRRRGRPRADRQAGRPRALGHDAADLERLLQPAAQRDRLPGRHPAAAGVRRERDRRGQLRRDRRRHRPRDQPRLRRPGRAVRRAGPARELVDAARTSKKFQARGAVRRRPVRRLLHRARHPPQRQAGARRVDRRPRRREDRLPRVPEVAQARRARRRRSTASRPSSSSSSPGASSAATRSARRRSG